MAPTKRSSVTGAPRGRPAKRTKAEPLAGKCDAIAEAVKTTPGFPKGMLQMVAGTVKASLQEVKEERHEFAENCLKMIDEVLKASQASVGEKVCALEAKVSESDAEKVARTTAAEAAVATLTEKTEALTAAKASHTEACQEAAASKTAHAEAEEENKSGAVVHAKAVENKAKLESVLSGDFNTLKQTTVSKLVKAFIKFARDFDFDGNLVDAAEVTLSKPSDARGTFDALVMKELDKAFSDKIAIVEDLVRNEEPAKVAREAKVEATAARLSTAIEEEQAQKVAVAEAQAALKEAEAAKKASDRAVKDFGPEMKRAAAELAAARKELSECEGVRGSFTELAERTASAPEEEEVPEEAAQESANAPAEEVAVPEEALAEEVAVEGQAS